MIELRQFHLENGRSPFRIWFSRLDAIAAAKVVTALSRVEAGNTSNVKALGEGVNELKINFGPGYRVYFGWDGLDLVILLGGGTKKRQGSDIRAAQRHWQDYKTRKKAAKKCH